MTIKPILNPEKLGYQFQTFKSIWNLVLEKNAQNESSFTIEFLVHEPDTHFLDSSKATPMKWTFDMQYLKAKCFDEAINLPYKMNEEVVKQSFYAVGALENMRLTALSKWLENIALQERENLYFNKCKP